MSAILTGLWTISALSSKYVIIGSRVKETSTCSIDNKHSSGNFQHGTIRLL